MLLDAGMLYLSVLWLEGINCSCYLSFSLFYSLLLLLMYTTADTCSSPAEEEIKWSQVQYSNTSDADGWSEVFSLSSHLWCNCWLHLVTSVSLGVSFNSVIHRCNFLHLRLQKKENDTHKLHPLHPPRILESFTSSLSLSLHWPNDKWHRCRFHPLNHSTCTFSHSIHFSPIGERSFLSSSLHCSIFLFLKCTYTSVSASNISRPVGPSVFSFSLSLSQKPQFVHIFELLWCIA